MSQSSFWQNTELSCALMALLASCSHEWDFWELHEIGEGPLDPKSVKEVMLVVSYEGVTKAVCSKVNESKSVLDIYQELSSADQSLKNKCSVVWQASEFCSDLVLPLPLNLLPSQWSLVRSSQGLATLYSRN